MAKQILKIILSLSAATLSLLCGLNAEKLFVKNLGLVITVFAKFPDFFICKYTDAFSCPSIQEKKFPA